MNSDAENIPPSLGLLPIRKLSSLIPLRKAARYQLDDPRDGSSRQPAFPPLKTSTNTFQSHIPVKTAEKRVLPAGKDKSAKKTKMATPNTKPTYAKLPASLNISTTPRMPMSPPPEEVLREQEKSMRKQSNSNADRERDRSFPSSTSSAGRKRARSITRNTSPNPKARKHPKLQKHDRYGGPDVLSGDWEQYTVPIKSSHDAEARKSRGSEPSARSKKSSETTRKDSRRRSSPAPSRSQSSSRPSVSRSRAQTPARGRPTTPVIIRTVPPPDINSLPPPAPPSPSDDPLWMPPPPARVRPAGDISIAFSRGRPSVADNSTSYSRRRSSYNAQASYRAVSPTPAPRTRPRASVASTASPPQFYAAAFAPSPPQFEACADGDVSMMYSAPIWNGEDDAGDLNNDFIVPLNFNNSTSDAPMPNFFPRSPQKSPRKATPIRRPGSPWVRSPSATDRENVDGGFGGFAPLQDAPSDDSDSEDEAPAPKQQESVAAPAQEEYHQEKQVPEEQEQAQLDPVDDSYFSPIQSCGRSATPARLSQQYSVVPTSTQQQTAGFIDSPASTTDFSGGKLLSQRFAELENKLAAEGRGFRFSEIGALPSSDGAVSEEAYERSQRLRFPDLPSSSPEKAVEEEEQDEESAEESRIEESLSSTPVEQEDPTESGFNEYSSQEDTEEVSPVEQRDYSVEQYHEEYEQPVAQDHEENEYSEERYCEQSEVSVEQYHQQQDFSTKQHQDSVQQTTGHEYSFQGAPQPEPSYHESAEIVAAAITNTSCQSGETVDGASFVAPREQEQVLPEQHDSKEATSPVRSPTISVREDEEDVSFISPIHAKESPLMDVASVSSEDSEDDMEEDDPVTETTYDQDVQSQQLSASVPVETPQSSQMWRRLPAEAKEDETAECDEEAEEEMTHGPSWGDETDAEPLVQIRSNDPMATARAAAILNLHHEYIQGTPKRQESSIWGSSSRRRSTSVMRTPAEPRTSQIFATPSRRNGDTSQLAPSPMIHASAVKPREPSATPSESGWRRVETVNRPILEWTKREWRCLEQCFTDVRMELAQSLDVNDVDPEEVDLDDVVVRFVESYGKGVRLDGEWKWEKMRRRAYALVPRQREGSARGLTSTITSPTQSVFTPARPTAPVIRTLQSMHDPLGPTSTLHAPRYAHLTQERCISPAVTNTPTPASQSHPSRSSRNMPPPAHIPMRINKPTSQGLYPTLTPAPLRPYQIPPSTPLGPTIKAIPEPTSASRKMWNWMGSFLKAGSEPPVSQETGEPREFIPSLPSISDADRDALRHVSPQPPRQPERIVPPKDQVQLQHVPTPVPIRIPRKLNHKGSSGSVKDLVKSFETISETESRVASRPFVIKKTSATSLRSMESSNEWSREQSQSQERSQDISVGSIRSVRSMVQNYSGSPAAAQQSNAAGRVHVGSFRMGDGARW